MLTAPKSWLTSSHVCGHVTRATWHLKVPADRSFAVDDFRHWNFSIWSTNKGVMAILVEGYNAKNASFWGGPIIMQFIDFLGIYPSTKMAITPLLVDQIEKFQCLELSTAPKLSPGIFRCHVARVTCPQTWLKVSELWGLFTNKVDDKRFQKSLFPTPRLST